MIRSINFKPVTNDFQKKFAEDINNMISSRNLLTFADKTTNLYEMTPEQCKTILTNNITRTCQKTECTTQLNINREPKTISKTLQLQKRFNPSKGKMGKISKTSSEEINNKLNNHQYYNQWSITPTVTAWFKAVENKKTCKFIRFDVAEFYRSISAELLEKSCNFARSIIKIEDKTINIFKHTRKSLLYSLKMR